MGLFSKKPDIELMKKESDINGLIKAAAKSRKDTETLTKAIDALLSLGEIDAVINLMVNKDFMPVLSSKLAQLGKPAVQPLINALSAEDKLIQGGAAITLGLIGDIKAVDPLINVFKDKNSQARIPAAVALGHFSNKGSKIDKKVFTALKDSLLHDPDPQIKQAASSAIQDLKSAGGKEFLKNVGAHT